MAAINTKTVAIIGAGSLGLGLARLFSSQGFTTIIGTRHPNNTAQKVSTLVRSNPSSNTKAALHIDTHARAVRHADLSILTVPDANIQTVCSSLSSHFKSESVVAHCSGLLDSQILDSAKQTNNSADNNSIYTCSLHPLNSFPDPAAAMQLFNSLSHNTYLYCEGDRPALHRLLPIFTALGFQTQEITQQAKPLYHAACVFACNYLTSLMDLSLQTAQASGLEPSIFWHALQPLIQTTLNNISAKGTAQALSGPIARGDTTTVATHLEQLSSLDKNIGINYTQLGKVALRLAQQQSQLTPQTAKKLKEMLELD